MSDRPTEPDVETLWEGEVPHARGHLRIRRGIVEQRHGCGDPGYEWRISDGLAHLTAAHLATQLRDLQSAAREYRAASDELAAADAAYRLAGMSSDRGAYKDASSRLTNAEARLHVADAALAAQLPPPAEGAKGGG
jgi:hypothetical protein